MKIYPDASHLKVIIPATFVSYVYDYHTNWCVEPVTKETIDDLEKLLQKIQKAFR